MNAFLQTCCLAMKHKNHIKETNFVSFGAFSLSHKANLNSFLINNILNKDKKYITTVLKESKEKEKTDIDRLSVYE